MSAVAWSLTRCIHLSPNPNASVRILLFSLLGGFPIISMSGFCQLPLNLCIWTWSAPWINIFLRLFFHQTAFTNCFRKWPVQPVFVHPFHVQQKSHHPGAPFGLYWPQWMTISQIGHPNDLSWPVHTILLLSLLCGGEPLHLRPQLIANSLWHSPAFERWGHSAGMG